MTIADFVTVEWAPASDPTSLSPTWVDITSVIQEVTVSGGRSGVFDLYGPRTATIKARNGRRSPAEAATWTVSGFYRWRQIRVTSTAGEVFTGYILSVTHDQTNSPWVGEVTIECTDIMGILAQAEFKPTDTSGNVVNRLRWANKLSDSISFAISLTGVDTSVVDVNGASTAYYKLPDEPSDQVLSWMQSLMEGEVGGIQVQANGALRVNGRWDVFSTSTSSPTVTFSDTPGVGESKYLRENLTFASTDTDYYNRAVAKTAYHDPTFTVENVPSGYPKETLSRTDLPFIYETWAEANAHLYSKLYSTPFTYPRTMKVYIASTSEASADIANFVSITFVFGVGRIAIKHTPVGSTQATYMVTVENCTHTITPEVWTCELGFASLDRWLTAYGDGTDISPLVQIGGDGTVGIGSTAIIAP